jgi:hypothetical protein
VAELGVIAAGNLDPPGLAGHEPAVRQHALDGRHAVVRTVDLRDWNRQT